MNSMLCIALLLVAVVGLKAGRPKVSLMHVMPGDFEVSAREKLQAYEEIERLAEALTADTTQAQTTGSRLLSFSYKNCGSPNTDLANVKSLSLQPDPIKLPGNITVSMDSVIKAKVGAPLKAVIKVYKKILFWVKVKTIEKDDLCAEIAKKMKTCPPELKKQGFNCACPFPAKPLVIKALTFNVKRSVPSIAQGEFKVHTVVTSGKKQVMCAEVELTLK